MSVETNQADQATEPQAVDEDSVESWNDAPNDSEADIATAKARPAQDDEPADAGEGTEGTEADPYAEAPEFWSAERKALWAKITDPEIRQTIHEQEKERVIGVTKQIQDATLGRKEIETKLEQFTRERDELAKYWQGLAPQLANAFRGKYEGVDEVKFAAEDPAGYTRWQAERQRDLALIQNAAATHQREVAAAQQRAEQALDATKRSEHAKLAEKFPDHFAGDKAKVQKTYDDLRDYLIEQGTPVERISNVYESFVVGIALKAMLYDKAQAAARRPSPATTATTTPRRIAPGPTREGGNQGTSEARQAMQRLKAGERLSRKDSSILFA